MTLHLTNWASRAEHGPGTKISAMAKPLAWMSAYGIAPNAAPHLLDLEAIRSDTITIEEYTARCVARWAYFAALDRYLPGKFDSVRPEGGRRMNIKIADGDSLLCTCPRRGSHRWRRPCHLESLAPFLVRAGWRVLLYGEEVTV